MKQISKDAAYRLLCRADGILCSVEGKLLHRDNHGDTAPVVGLTPAESDTLTQKVVNIRTDLLNALTIIEKAHTFDSQNG